MQRPVSKLDSNSRLCNVRLHYFTSGSESFVYGQYFIALRKLKSIIIFIEFLSEVAYIIWNQISNFEYFTYLQNLYKICLQNDNSLSYDFYEFQTKKKKLLCPLLEVLLNYQRSCCYH